MRTAGALRPVEPISSWSQAAAAGPEAGAAQLHRPPAKISTQITSIRALGKALGSDVGEDAHYSRKASLAGESV